MKLTLTRVALLDDSTLGMLSASSMPQPLAGDVGALCWTLEDAWRGNQRYVSCIPDGEYILVPHDGPRWKNVWRVTRDGTADVPGRSAILLHPGTDVDHSLGCIMIGEAWVQSTLSRVRLTESSHHATLERLRLLLGRERHELKVATRSARL